MNWPPIWEGDTFWWEKVCVSEFGLPEKLNFVVPDKLTHFLACFGLTWLFYVLLGKWVTRHGAAAMALFLMMVPWEIVWDGMFRYGMSWRDMIANTLGTLVCWWWLATYDNVGQSQVC